MMSRLFCILFLTLSLHSIAKAEIRAYGAFAPLLQLPGSLRVGGNNWEFGLIMPGVLGVDKLFHFQKYYAAWGVVVGLGTSPGFYGAIGMSLDLFWGFYFRGELGGAGLINGYARAEGQVGLEYIF